LFEIPTASKEQVEKNREKKGRSIKTLFLTNLECKEAILTSKCALLHYYDRLLTQQSLEQILF
jgi:hypothetical protein